MKIRTITLGFNLKVPLSELQIKRMAATVNRIRSAYEEAGYEVQTVRLATQPWDTYASKPGFSADLARDMEELARSAGARPAEGGASVHQPKASTLCNLAARMAHAAGDLREVAGTLRAIRETPPKAPARPARRIRHEPGTFICRGCGGDIGPDRADDRCGDGMHRS